MLRIKKKVEYALSNTIRLKSSKNMYLYLGFLCERMHRPVYRDFHIFLATVPWSVHQEAPHILAVLFLPPNTQSDTNLHLTVHANAPVSFQNGNYFWGEIEPSFHIILFSGILDDICHKIYY